VHGTAAGLSGRLLSEVLPFLAHAPCLSTAIIDLPFFPVSTLWFSELYGALDLLTVLTHSLFSYLGSGMGDIPLSSDLAPSRNQDSISGAVSPSRVFFI